MTSPKPAPPTLVPAPEAAMGPEDEGPDIRAYLRTIRKHIRSIVVVFVVVVTAATVWTLRQPKIYEADTSVVIDPMAPRALKNVSDVVEIGAGTYWASKEFYETEYKIIESRDVSQRVVEKLGLDKDPSFLGLDKIKDPARRDAAMRHADAVGELQSRIQVTPIKDSRMVLIGVTDTDPQRAALLSTAVAEAYRDQNLEKRIEGTGNVVEWLDEQIKELKPRLEASEMALYDYRKKNDMLTASLEDRENIVSQKLLDLNKTLTDIRTKRIAAEAEVERIRQLQKDPGNDTDKYSVLPEVTGSPLIQKLKEVLSDQEQTYAKLQQRYLPKHPKIIAAREALDVTRASLKSEVDNVVASILGSYQELNEAEGGVERLLAQVKAEAFDLNKKKIGYDRLEREEKDNERLYGMVLERVKEASLTGQQRTNNIHIVDSATVPGAPIKPSLRRNLMLGGMLGLFLGLGLAFLRDYLDNTVKTQGDVENELGLAFLGIIPMVPERAAGDAGRALDLHVIDNPRGQVAEACRSIRTNLLFMSPDMPLRRLLVTSAGPREGKTTTVVDLGIVMAQSGASVVLVDTDMRRPRLHRAFGVSGELGLSSVILGEATLEEVLKETSVAGLYLLPCGPLPPNPAELLHTARFAAILKDLDKRFERVVLDSPPLGAVADAKVLSVAADGTLLVAKANQTARDMLRRSAESLLEVNSRILGVILNQVDLERQEYGDYYQYYRQYGAYYGDESRRQEESP